MHFFWKVVSIFRLNKNKEELPYLNERFGIANDNALKTLQEFLSKNYQNSKKVVWLHAVSVGESLSVLNFVEKLCHNGWFVVFTTTTVTSANLIRKRLPQYACHQYNPYPSTKYVKKFLKTWQPTIAFFVESEIFPNILSILKKQNIHSYLINARMSNRSFNRWKKIKFYIKCVLLKYDCIFPQSEVEEKKFQFLSDDKATIKCLGNMKIDTTLSSRDDILKEFNTTENNSASIAKCKLLLQTIKQNDKNKKIIVFGSIHEEEFFHLIWQYSMIEKNLNCIGIFVPRYIEESEKLKEIAQKSNLNPSMWSDFYGNSLGNIIIVDELGILLNLYHISDFSIVCGNFAEHIGGHNALEPIAFNKPTFVGQYCTKCQDTIDALLYSKAVIQTKHLYKDLLNIALNDAKQKELVDNGKKFINQNKGATEKVYNDIFKSFNQHPKDHSHKN